MDMSPRSLEKVLYFAAFVVTDPGDTQLQYKQLLNDKEYKEHVEKFRQRLQGRYGRRGYQGAFEQIDLDEEAAKLRKELTESTGQKRVRAVKRLEVVEAFRKFGNRPEWIVLDVVLVIPPGTQADGAAGRRAFRDLRPQRPLPPSHQPQQPARAFWNCAPRYHRSQRKAHASGSGRRAHRQRPPRASCDRAGQPPAEVAFGYAKRRSRRFRQNLLGKRADYSGRSVIVVGPELKMYQCGLPKEMWPWSFSSRS